MSIGVKAFRGERLKEARLVRGIHKKTLGERIGVTGAAIGRYENNIDKPTTEKLDAIVTELNFSREFFCKAPWPEEIELVHWRSRADETKAARDMTQQRIKWLCEIFGLLENSLDFPKIDIPLIDIPEDFRLLTGNDIEHAALRVREHWRLGTSPIPDVILALENAGIPVATLKISSDKQDGFFYPSRVLQRGFVGINIREASCARARFDAAHELGHLILHRNARFEQVKLSSGHNILEKQAHRFAGSFLFPRESFLREVHDFSLDYFASLKRRWGFSIAGMIMRAFDLGLVDQDMKRYLFKAMSNRQWRGFEPYDSPRDMPMERPRMLRRGFDALNEIGVSKLLLASDLAIPFEEIETLVGLNEGELQRFADRLDEDTAPRLKVIDLESGKVVQFRRPK